MNMFIHKQQFCVFPEKDGLFILRFAGMFTHLLVYVEYKYSASAYGWMVWVYFSLVSNRFRYPKV